MTIRLSAHDAGRCLELIEECLDLWDDPVLWQDHLTSGASKLIGGCSAVFGLTRMPARGLAASRNITSDLHEALLCHRAAPEIRETHIAASTDPALRARFSEYVQDGGFGLLPEVHLVIRGLLDHGGLTYRQSALVDRRAYYRSPVYQMYLEAHRIEDMLSAVHKCDDGVVVGLSVLRSSSDRRFSENDEAILEVLALATARRLGTRLTTRAHVGRHSLSPRLRDTLTALLDGVSEKEIACRLDISPTTAHEYVKAIFRRFDVRSRAELMALYVRRRPSRD